MPEFTHHLVVMCICIDPVANLQSYVCNGSETRILSAGIDVLAVSGMILYSNCEYNNRQLVLICVYEAVVDGVCCRTGW